MRSLVILLAVFFGGCSGLHSSPIPEQELNSRGIGIVTGISMRIVAVDGAAPDEIPFSFFERIRKGYWTILSPGSHIVDLEFDETSSPLLSGVTFEQSFKGRVLVPVERGKAYQIVKSVWIDPSSTIYVWVEERATEKYVWGNKPVTVDGHSYYLQRECVQNVCGATFRCNSANTKNPRQELGRSCQLND